MEREIVKFAIGRSSDRQPVSKSRKGDRLVYDNEWQSCAPGPGAYEPKSAWKEMPKITIKPRAERDYMSNTANVDFLPQPKVQTKPITIGTRKSCRYYQQSSNPLPCTILPSTLKNNKITIGKKTEITHDNNVPGPGQYVPKNPDRRITSSLNYGPRKPLWEVQPDIPGPGAYNAYPQAPKPKRWAQYLRQAKPKVPVKQIQRLENQEKEKKEYKFIHL